MLQTNGLSGFGVTMHLLSFAIAGCLGVGFFMAIGKVDDYKIAKTSELVQVTDSISSQVQRDTIYLESPMPVCQVDSFIVNGDTLYLKMSISPNLISKEHE
jgi:hypothetical protein